MENYIEGLHLLQTLETNFPSLSFEEERFKIQEIKRDQETVTGRPIIAA